jgi:hypothetical protein
MADNLICGRGVDKNRLAEVLRKEFLTQLSMNLNNRNNSEGKLFSEKAIFYSRWC